MIKDNPLPVILPLKCLGQKPVMEIIEGDGLQFDRLLLNQSLKQQIVLKNVSAIPLKWNLSGLDQLPSEFVIINTEGELQPSKQTIVEVQFKAIQQMKFSQKLYLEVQDIESMNIKQEPRPISIDAEAFDISVQFKFPNDALSDINQNSDSMQQENNLLDFGSVRVGEIKEQTFTIKNNGLYKVKYNFKMNKKLFRECFQIEPNESELEPGMDKIVAVRFLSKNQEIKLKTTNNTTDILMEILEGKTQELVKPVPINVNVNSVYSKYSITPLKKINFGPIMFSENKQRTFEIKNEGMFEFNFNVFDYSNEETRLQIKEQNQKEMEERMQLQSTNDKQKGKAAPNQQKQAVGKGKDNKGQNQQQLKVGQYIIQPFQGSIQPDQSQVIEIIFQGQNQQIYEQKLAIDVSCRDPTDESEGILYEMVGESCIPGICTENYQAIFEEQVVIPSLQSTGSIAGVVNSNIFSIEEKIFFFGTLVPSKVPDGIEEKFKIINPNKVQCSVKFDVRKRNNNQMEQFGFEVFPKQVKISPHEHTYVKVLFKPTIMATYSGIFEALVEQGEQNVKTQKLLFDLRGEGALPTLKLEQPKEYLDERTPIMKFPKLRINKSMVQNILLKNDGQIPATVKIDSTQSNNFRFLSQTSYTLLPKTYQSFQVEFNPSDSGIQSHHIQFTTLLNHYESWKILLQGEGFYEDISFEGLPNNREDELELGDCYVNIIRKTTFMVKNNSNKQIRFNWNLNNVEELTVFPKIGHIEAQKTKSITLQFLSQKSIQFSNQQIQLEYKQIEQSNTKFIDWDDSMTTVRYISQREKDYLEQKKEEEKIRKEQELANQQKGKKPNNQQQQVNKSETQFIPDDNDVLDIAYEESVVEPEFNVIQQQDKNIPLKVNCVCDLVRYECEVQQILFKSTMMFTNRVYQFKLRNTSTITMKYDNKLCTELDQLWDPGYFSITPKQGIIKSNCDELFTVKFSPTEVEPNNYRLLQIQMDNLDPQQQELTIDIDGESDRPICHFELPPTIIKSEKDNIKIFEFESLGIKIKNTKRFYIVNPTSTGYEFEWTKVEEEKNPNNTNTGNYNYFRCVTQKGVVLSGKKFEMIFEYQPEQFGNHVVYYMFSIPEFKLEQQFMIYGSVKEPKVFLDVGKVNFGPLLLGGKNKEIVYLKNLEDVPIQFSFDKQSIKGEPEYNDSLQIKPISGVVKSQNEIPIEIMFYPQNEIQYNYNLSCNVQRKSQPLNLNVKGIGYILHHQVNLEGINSALSPQDLTLLNFEDIFINEKRVKKLTIENKGDFNFDYSIKRSTHVNLINIKPENGTVRKHEKVVVEVTFAPSNIEHKFKGKASRLSLQIISGPTYHFDIKGSSRKPNVELSFMEYNFGPSFVLKRPLPVQTILELKNKDKQAMSLEANFEKTNYLDIQLANGQVLLPFNNNNNILKVPIVFTPRDIMKYEETIQLDINNLHKMELKVMGEGIPFKIDLDKQEDQVINFGTVKTGQDITKTVYIVNHSKKAINITFDNENQLQSLKENYLYISPSKNMKIMAKEKREVEIRFNPQIRLHKFNYELFYKIVENNEPRKLLNIEGICHGLELKLMEDTLGFGQVVINSKLSKHLQLANLGDIGAYFQWDTVFCKQFFTINPKQGFISPHEDVNFEVTFHPNVVDNDIRFNKVKCNIENQNPLYITLLGKCVAQPKEQVQQLTFETMVRQQTKQKIQLKNPTNQIWKIKSTITIMNSNYQSYFYGNEYIEVPANGSADYEINYYPLTMTTHSDQPSIKEQQHDGSIFFPLPDGTAIVYDLVGKALPPTPIQLDNTQFKAKTNGQYVIKVQNWLKETQRFNVQLKLENEDDSIFVNAANTIDIMGEGTKDYKLIVFSLKSNSNTLVITFTNSQTFEYMQYKLPLTFNAPDILNNIELNSVVRESVSKLITIENPLPQQVVIKSDQFVSDNDNITFNPSNFTIPAKSEFGYEVNYRPLIAGDFQSKFSLKSPELGDFTYQMQLKGIQNTSQKQLIFKTALATEIVQTFKFYNYLKKAVTYSVKIDKLGSQIKQAKDAKIPAIDFSLENAAQANIQAAATDSFEGLEVPINIRFEPSSLLESKALLTVSNQEGGEYQCILVGHSLSPQPKGPFKITGPKPPPIEFKNPFFESMEFTIRIDNPSFTANVKSPIKIDAKKNISISLTYKPVPSSTNNGRLTISTEDMPSWVFYLQGE